MGLGGDDAIVEAGNEDVAVAVFERGDDFGDGLQRVGSGAAVDAGVQIVIGAFDMQFGIDHAAQADADGGQLGREHFGVADDGGVGFQARRAW